MDVVPVEIVAPQTQMLDTQRESDLPSCNIEWALTGAEHDHESLARRHRPELPGARLSPELKWTRGAPRNLVTTEHTSGGRALL